jgi:hypothetical protein
MWSGISLTEARAIWTRQQTNFASVHVEGWEAAILRKDLDALAQAGLQRPLVRLLPYFDTFLLGHKERGHLVNAQYHPHVYRPQGWIAPVVLVDGRVAAVWESVREVNQLRVNVRQFMPMSRRIITSIWEEARDLGRLLEAESAKIQITGAGA